MNLELNSDCRTGKLCPACSMKVILCVVMIGPTVVKVFAELSRTAPFIIYEKVTITMDMN